jgi:(p)ppGpp synthase/HD superfamily hydrolase
MSRSGQLGMSDPEGTQPLFTAGEVGTCLGALAFAADRHRDQRRKGRSREPYINHPIRVAHLLWEVGGVRDTVMLAAALLHDVLEDTSTTPDELAARFGGEVRALVEEMTDDKSLPKADRKELQIEHAHDHSERAKMIKLADKIQNVLDLSRDPPASWSQKRVRDYIEWADEVVAGLRGVNPALEARYDEVALRARAGL